MTTPAFAGSVPDAYHTYLGPLIFHEYARDMVDRLALNPGDRVLELAAGTGIVSQRITSRLPEAARLVATDLSPPMLDLARRAIGQDPRVELSIVDACSIPMPDASFDRLACQFGVMFFPDKVRAMREARRVLKPGGRYVFNIWDSLEHNPIPRTVQESLARLLPKTPSTFLGRIPYGYFDPKQIELITREGGFKNVVLEAVDLPSVAPTAEDAARAFVEGTPVAGDLVAAGTDPSSMRAQVAEALAKRFGDRPCRSTMRAIVVTAS